ncbi:zinc finger protein RFP-like [Aptenodytes patagonicus]|uniref:zinc finger protein RFP-like n=1 Tax=Aptenodytes patagonicus TaxID=9234 RepID=UPI003FA01F90
MDAKSLNLRLVKEVEGGENFCKEHQETLKLFCEDEERLICVVCNRSKAHRNHSVVPVDEAAQQYKKRTEAEKQKIVTKYKQLQKFLEEQESFLLAQLDTEIMNTHEGILTRLLEETTSLGTLAGEMERICQQPGCELLKDIRTTLRRYAVLLLSKFHHNRAALWQDTRRNHVATGWPFCNTAFGLD